ncbi:hypothetical protein JCM10207_005509 [Rhodosporidiobolus poonsookiae]
MLRRKYNAWPSREENDFVHKQIQITRAKLASADKMLQAYRRGDRVDQQAHLKALAKYRWLGNDIHSLSWRIERLNAEWETFCRRGVIGIHAIEQAEAELEREKQQHPGPLVLQAYPPGSDGFYDVMMEVSSADRRIKKLEKEIAMLEERFEDKARYAETQPLPNNHPLQSIVKSTPLSFRQQHYYRQPRTSQAFS